MIYDGLEKCKARQVGFRIFYNLADDRYGSVTDR